LFEHPLHRPAKLPQASLAALEVGDGRLEPGRLLIERALSLGDEQLEPLLGPRSTSEEVPQPPAPLRGSAVRVVGRDEFRAGDRVFAPSE
jgi:hypothetical protein